MNPLSVTDSEISIAQLLDIAKDNPDRCAAGISWKIFARNDADGKLYLYDIVDVNKKKTISTASFSAKTHSEVFAPKSPNNRIY